MPTSHLQFDYDRTRLYTIEARRAQEAIGTKKPQGTDELIEAILRALMSKKFRKYSASVALQTQIREAIKINVEKNEPINITFLHGAYKLWRLEETQK